MATQAAATAFVVENVTWIESSFHTLADARSE